MDAVRQAKIRRLYKGWGPEYPNTLASNILWVLWGVLAAVVVVFLSKKFTMLHAFALSWLVVFAMHWIGLWNFAILPLDLL